MRIDDERDVRGWDDVCRVASASLFVPKADLFVHERNIFSFLCVQIYGLTTLGEQSTSTRGKTTAPVGHGCGAANASNKLWPRCRLVDGVDCQHDVPRNFCE